MEPSSQHGAREESGAEFAPQETPARAQGDLVDRLLDKIAELEGQLRVKYSREAKGGQERGIIKAFLGENDLR